MRVQTISGKVCMDVPDYWKRIFRMSKEVILDLAVELYSDSVFHPSEAGEMSSSVANALRVCRCFTDGFGIYMAGISS